MNNSNLGNEFSENVADSGSKQNGRWTKEEHLKFLEGKSKSIQGSSTTAKTGKRSNKWLKLEMAHR